MERLVGEIVSLHFRRIERLNSIPVYFIISAYASYFIALVKVIKGSHCEAFVLRLGNYEKFLKAKVSFWRPPNVFYYINILLHPIIYMLHVVLGHLMPCFTFDGTYFLVLFDIQMRLNQAYLSNCWQSSYKNDILWKFEKLTT